MVNENANVKITLNNKEAQDQLQELQKDMLRFIELKKKAQEEGDVEAFKQWDKELKKAGRSASKLQKEYAQIEDVLKDINGASLNDLEKAKRVLSKRVKGLKRDTEEWKREAGNLSKIQSEIGKVKTKMGLLQSPMKKAIGFAKGMLPAFSFAAIVAGVGSVIRKMNQATDAADNFEERLDNLSALTGLEGSELEKLGDIAKKTSVKITDGNVRIKQSADDIVDAYTKVGSQRPELLKNAEALAEVTEDAIILSEAAKSELEPAVAGLTTIMNQFNLGASESRRIINAMAAGSKEGAADIPYLTEAIEKSGTTMDLMNVPLEQNIGLIEAIAPKYSKASLAGNSLDKVFLKLKEKQIGYVDGAFSVNEALEELESRYKNGESAASIFGVEHAKMGELLVQNKDEINRYTKAVTGTNIAIEQAAKNTNNAKAVQAQARNEFHLSAIELGESLSPAMVTVYKAAGKIASAFTKMIEASPAESIMEEQKQVNALAVELTDANTKEDRRRKILEELEKINPKITAGLSAENIETGKLKDNLRLYNEELANRIVLANLEEDEQKQAAKAAKAKIKLVDEQYELQQLIGKVNPDIAFGDGTLEEKAKKIQAILKETGNVRFYGDDAVNEDKINLVGIGNKLKNIAAYQKDLEGEEGQQLDFKKRMEAIKKLLGLTVPSEVPTTDPAVGSLKTVGNEVFEWDGKTWKFKEKVGGSGGSGTGSGENPEMVTSSGSDGKAPGKVEAKNVTLEEKKEEYDILEEMHREFLATEKELNEAELKDEQAIADQWAEFNEQQKQGYIDLANAKMNAAGQVINTLIKMAGEESKIGKALFLLNQARAVGQVIFNTGIANAKAVAASPLTLGQPWVTINSINAGASIATILGETIAQFATGKYPDSQFAGRPQTGMYGSKPQLGIFNEVPGQPEMVVDGITTRNLQVNYPDIVDAIYSVRDGRVPQYAQGKYPDNPVKEVAATSNDENLTAIIAANTAAMQAIKKLKIYTSIEDIEKGRENYSKIKENSAFKNE